MENKELNNDKELKKFLIEANAQIQAQRRRSGIPPRLRGILANPTPGPKRYTDFNIAKNFKKDDV